MNKEERELKNIVSCSMTDDVSKFGNCATCMFCRDYMTGKGEDGEQQHFWCCDPRATVRGDGRRS